MDPTNLDNFVTPLRLPGGEGVMGRLDASNAPVRLAARRESVEVLPGKKTDLLIYRAEQGAKTYANPLLKVEKSSGFCADFANDLGEETTIHWHGMHLDWRADGHPLRPVAPGVAYRYAFPVLNRGGTYWYHPHAHGSTARQAYSGLAGFFVVEDEDDRSLSEALDLRLGETDVPLLIQDKTFDEGGNLLYAPDAMAESMGYEGDTILVNLMPNPCLEVSTRTYRFRLLNGSNARVYRLAFASSGNGGLLPYQVIGTDGGLLAHPYPATEVFLAPGERVDLLLDLTRLEAGGGVVLKSLAFDPMHREHEPGEDMGHASHGGHAEMSGMPHADMGGMGPARLPGGQEFYVLKLVVKERVGYDGSLPEVLSTMTPIDAGGANARSLTLSSETSTDETGQMATRWLIDGRTYRISEHPIVIRRGTIEVWELRNEERSMPHPMHLHGFQFRVLGRSGSPEQVRSLAVDGQGRTVTDLGWKDTVLIWPGETVRIAIDFSHGFEGEQLYLFHCHILEHEDAGMMLNFKVV